MPGGTNTNLRQARLDAGLNQAQLALVVGLSRQAINQYERLQTRPSPDTGRKIAYALSLRNGRVYTYTDLFPLAEEAA